MKPGARPPFPRKPRSLAGAALFLCCASAAGQQGGDANLPLWEAGVFGGSASTPAYPASDERTTRSLVLPFLLYRGEVLRADQSGIGARLLHNDAVEFDVGFALSLPARSRDVPARRGMPDLGTLVEFGPRLKVNLANPTPGSHLRLEAPLRAVIEVRGGLRREGLAFEPRLVWEQADPLGTWNLDANLGVVLGNAALNNYFYEVQPQLATDQRSPYRARPGMLLARAGASAWRMLGPDWRILGFIRYDNYAIAANRDSPLFRQNTEVSAGIGFAWTWRRSQESARK